LERFAADPAYTSPGFETWSYLSRGRYAEQLKRWFEHVARDQVLVMDSAVLFNEPAEALGRTTEFLGLPPHPLPAYKAYNVRDYPEPDPETLAWLRNYFEPHNRRLWGLLGEDYGWEDAGSRLTRSSGQD
jgi:hypothetical protein